MLTHRGEVRIRTFLPFHAPIALNSERASRMSRRDQPPFFHSNRSAPAREEKACPGVCVILESADGGGSRINCIRATQLFIVYQTTAHHLMK